MEWIDQLKDRIAPKKQLATTAEEIAMEVFDAVWRRVQFKAGLLAPTSYRGYVRAQAEGIVRSAVARYATPFDPADLHAATMEATIRRITTQALFRVHSRAAA